MNRLLGSTLATLLVAIPVYALHDRDNDRSSASPDSTMGSAQVASFPGRCGGVTVTGSEAKSMIFVSGTDSDAGRGAVLMQAIAAANKIAFADAADGNCFMGGLTRLKDGNFYGVSTCGGDNLVSGVVYKLTSSGSYSVVHAFDSAAGEPRYCQNTLTQDAVGDLWGVSEYSGGGYGAIFKVHPADGTLTVIHDFTGNDGARGYGKLLFARDGNLYGTTQYGGSRDCGTIYRVTTSGSYSVIRTLAGSDGTQPYAGLVEGTDGSLYGVCSKGNGTNARGTLFKLNKDGTGFAVLHIFRGGGDGQYPLGGLMQDGGAIYGTTFSGGTHNYGTIWKYNTDNAAYSVVKHFDRITGSYPVAQLIKASDGNYYGLTREGGANNVGVVYKLTNSGSYSVIGTCTKVVGYYPWGGLAEASDGTLWFATQLGGENRGGDICKIGKTGDANAVAREIYAARSGDSNTVIALSPGVYEVDGTQYLAGNNITLEGNGSTIRAKAGSNTRGYVVRFHMFSHMPRHRVTFRNCTVDCNLQNMTRNQHLGAVYVYSLFDSILYRIRGINGGNRFDNNECFGIVVGTSGGGAMVGTPNDTFIGGIAERNIIDQCVWEQPVQVGNMGGTSAIVVSGGNTPDERYPGNGWAVNCVLKDSIVRNALPGPVLPGYMRAFTMSMTSASKCLNCTASDLNVIGSDASYVGFYTDTGSMMDLVVDNFHAIRCRFGVALEQTDPIPTDQKNITIRNCTFSGLPGTTNYGVVAHSGSGAMLNNLRILNNRISDVTEGITIKSGAPSVGLDIRGNRIHASGAAITTTNFTAPKILRNYDGKGNVIVTQAGWRDYLRGQFFDGILRSCSTSSD